MPAKSKAKSGTSTITRKPRAVTPPIAPTVTVPPLFNSIQVNFCKNPICGNFGVPADVYTPSKGSLAASSPIHRYNVVGTGRNAISLECMVCGQYPTIKSNQGIHEELQRMVAYFEPQHPQTFCPKAGCSNQSISVDSWPFQYSRHGRTSSGADRFRCKRCGATFTVSLPEKPTARQKVHKHKNIQIFKLLVGKSPLRRIAEIEELPMKSLYDKIDFLYRQCRSFAGSREKLLPSMSFERLRISVDRQDYTINWSDTNDKRNTVLRCLTSADNWSSFVFAAHLNYDPDIEKAAVLADSLETGDFTLKMPFRRYARLKLNINTSTSAKPAAPATTGGGPIIEQVKETYDEAVAREDIECPEESGTIRKLPDRGVQVNEDYTMYAHFQFLQRLLSGVQDITFYMDQESGIRAACFAAFHEEVLNRKCNAFYVKIDKELTVHEKLRLHREAQWAMDEYVDKHPLLAGLRIDDIRLFYLSDMLPSRRLAGPWDDEWLDYPFPDMAEPKKGVCWLTDLNDGAYDDLALAKMFQRATLHGVDRFFMQLRRRVSLLERPIQTSSSARRVWYAYGPYNPVVVVKMLEIYRVYYNYVKKGQDGKTPAMRLGLARGPVGIDDIVYFMASGA